MAQPTLRNDVLRVADLARISVDELRDQFCISVCDRLEKIWNSDELVASLAPGPALIKAAEAARTLSEAVCSMNKQDRVDLDKIARQDPELSQERFRGATEPFQINELDHTVWLLALLFSTAVGKSWPPMHGLRALRETSGRPRGDIGNPVFQDLVFSILSCAMEAGGKLTVDKNNNKGTLIEALGILRPHFPPGVVPNVLSGSTLSRLKSAHSKAGLFILAFQSMVPNGTGP